jgi:uncharacterized protein (DUF1778 family)
MAKQQPSDQALTKQMKVFLTIEEHTVVTAAANLKNMHVRDYMKQAVIAQAQEKPDDSE